MALTDNLREQYERQDLSWRENNRFDNQGRVIEDSRLKKYSPEWFIKRYEKVEQSELIFENNNLMMEISQIGRDNNYSITRDTYKSFTLPRW